MNGKIRWNLNWYFCQGFCQERVRSGSTEGMEQIHLPHQVKTLTYNCFSHDDTQMISTYAKRFTLTAQEAARRAVVEFDGVMTYFDLYVNGHLAGSHKGGYSRARMEITPYIHQGENTLFVMVDSHERDDIPPFGCVIDYITFGGIYRDVNLYLLPEAFLTDVLFRYDMTGQSTAQIYPEFYADNAGLAFTAQIRVTVADRQGQVLTAYSQQVQVGEGKTRIMLERRQVSGIRRWDPEDPWMYRVQAELEKDGQALDSIADDIGFRTYECRPEGMLVNGRPITLVGMDRHQSYPYIGYSIGKRAQQADADLLKQYGLNTVRTSHYMQSQYFLDRCDEIGLMVFEEIPGWQFIGGEDFKQVVLQDVRSMIVTDFNHPGIFIWGVRINESLDDDDLYTRTNALARELDPSRATGGVRCYCGSHLLEDVYTMNDFCHAGTYGGKGSSAGSSGSDLRQVLRMQQEVTGLPYKVPYMVTEYMGHTYPAKQFDNEFIRDEHARRHADILARTLQKHDSLGSIGWCAFDYNTHGDYGAGDKICYHGIFDMFRIPKYAAYVYRTQKSPQQEVLMLPITGFSRGEKPLYGIMPFLVLTNCDYIEVFMYGKSLGLFYPSNRYFGLPHPPIEVDVDVDVFWNERWQDGKIVGYLDGKAVSEYRFLRDPHLDGFAVTQDDAEISASEVDTARFEVRFVDQLGHVCTFYNGVIQVETEGDIQLIGPKFLAPTGGQIAFWVKSVPTGRDSVAKVRIQAPALDYPAQEFEIRLKKD